MDRFFSSPPLEEEIEKAKDHTKIRSEEHLVWQRQSSVELRVEWGKSGGFTSSQRTACGVGRREGMWGWGQRHPRSAGLPVSSGYVNRGLQFSRFCFSNLQCLWQYLITRPLSIFLPCFLPTLFSSPFPSRSPAAHPHRHSYTEQPHKVKFKTQSSII